MALLAYLLTPIARYFDEDRSEGAIDTTITATDGGVTIEFDRPVTRYSLPTAEQADRFAHRVQCRAAEARRCR